MAEAVFRSLQLGEETTFGTSVAATTVYPCDPGSGEFELDRSVLSPDEDYGMIPRHQPTRGVNGVRIATGSLSSHARYEDLPHILQMTASAAVTTGAGPYVHTFTGDTTSNTIKSYTVEINDDTQDFDITSVHCTSLDLGFDTLSAPGNSPWTLSAELRGVDKTKSTATAALSAPSTLETIEGAFTQLYEGTTGTAFGSLSELSGHLVMYRLTIADPKPLRHYGAASGDVASGYGRQKREISFEAQLKLSASSITNVFDIYNTSGASVTDRRWRISTTGSGNKSMDIDGRVRFTSVNVDPDVRDGERVLSVAGYYVYDSTLASDIVIAITNDTASY